MEQIHESTAVTALAYKPDWEETKQRYTAWWRGEKLDRCLLTVTSPRADADPDEKWPQRPGTPEERWTNLDYLTALNDYGHRRTFYGAEGFPRWNPGYPGHVGMPTFYGCPVTLDWDTGWTDAILTNEKLDNSSIRLRRSGKWWNFGIALMKHAKAAAAGKSIPSMCAIYGVGDTLAALRGTERLLYDLADYPQTVAEIELALADDWFEVFNQQTDIVKNGGDWYATWFGLWAPGRFYPTQCDCAYGISPKTFHEVYIPAIRKTLAGLDYSVYHVDGVGNFPHVDELCKIDELPALQILPGAGKPSPLHYLDTLRLVQRHGKRLHISIGPDEVPRALELLSARGLCIDTWARSEQQAREIIGQAEKLSRF
jgi:hypothetical protein